MLLVLAAFAWRYPLRGNTERLVDIGKLANYGRLEFVGYVGGMVVLFALYALALRETRRPASARALPVVFVCAAAFAVAMTAMYPVNAIDVFIYAVRSRLFTEYGVDPLSAYPIDYWADPFMRFASDEWADAVSPYGPLWNLIAWPITRLAGDRMGAALFGFKALAALCYLAVGAAIAYALAGTRPASAATGALFFLWNPLVLWEGVGNGHNDLVLLLPLVLALLAWQRRRDRWVIPLLVVATLIKYVTVLLLPLAAVALWRRAWGRDARWRLVAWSVTGSLLAVGVALFPFYDPGAVRASIADQGNIFLTSPAAMAIGLLHDRYPTAEIKRWAEFIGVGILLAVLIGRLLAVWHRPRRFGRAAFEVLFVFLLVATWNFRGWYLIWLVGLAALLPWGWPAWRTVAWTAGALAGYALFIWGWEWWDVDFYTIQNVAVPLMTGGAVLLTLAEGVVRLGGMTRRRGGPVSGVDS